jgi:hypothetical protein
MGLRADLSRISLFIAAGGVGWSRQRFFSTRVSYTLAVSGNIRFRDATQKGKQSPP